MSDVYVHIDEVRSKLERSLRRQLPEAVWEELVDDAYVRDHLAGTLEEDPEQSWQALKEAAEKRLRFADKVASEALGGVREVRRPAEQSREVQEKKVRPLVGPRPDEMARAMSELFAGLAHRYPEVEEFRERVLGGQWLSSDEAHELIASYAARVFSPEWFEEWGVPFIGHRAEVLSKGPRGEHFNPVDDWMTIRTDPPGVTKTVRYTYPRKGDHNTRCVLQGGAVLPIITGLPIESHGAHIYPSWLWPGSVVDRLYDISEELADAFGWPVSVKDTLGRQRNEAAAWFVLTGHAPEVRPVDGRWEPKKGKYLNPQWRIQLEVAPWVPAEEVTRAYRMLRRQAPAGRKLPKTVIPLEVAHFVWEQERLNDYDRPSWVELFRRWRVLYPDTRIKDYRYFRTYFKRGDAAVKELNFNWPQPRREGTSG